MDTSQYLDIFIDESTEHMDTLYDQLLELEKQPGEKAFIEEIFRAAHTLKGMSATMGYDDLAQLTHKMENIFDGIRYDNIQVQTEMMDYLFQAVDTLNEIVEDIGDGGDGERDVADMMSVLDEIENGADLSNSEQTATRPSENNIKGPALEMDEFQLTILGESIERGFNQYEIYIRLREDCLLKGARVYMVFELLEKMGEVVHTDPLVQDLEEENFDDSFKILFVSKTLSEEIEQKLTKVSEVDVVEVIPFSLETYKSQVGEKETTATTELQTSTEKDRKTNKPDTDTTKQLKAAPTKTIRVNIERLDILMNLFEELVIDRGRLEQISTDLDNSDLQETVERMSRVSSDLQSIILTMRMVPIDTVFSRFPRMIRQLARELQKEVDIDIIGADTELDRTVIDEIGDPLVHLIRNAMDHGIETPEEREALGKPRQGNIKLEAYHSGNHVFMEITDDGAGINKEKVMNKAIQKGVITESEAELMADTQVYELIMASGFSTNEEVSDVSGRGVGLDVVKNTIESLSGSITIDASPDKGSIFTIQLPLTLSIISVLLVELKNEKYAVPLSSIIETAVLHKDEIYNAHHHKVIDFRGNVVPLAFLSDIFQVPKEEKEEEYISIVIVRKGNRLTALVVDAFIGQQEVVLKSLGDYLTNVFAISGATILGDGEVALIIDSNALIK